MHFWRLLERGWLTIVYGGLVLLFVPWIVFLWFSQPQHGTENNAALLAGGLLVMLAVSSLFTGFLYFSSSRTVIHRLRSGDAVYRWRYRIRMARFVIDPPTLIHLSEGNVIVDSDHQLVAPSPVRSQALGILLRRVQAGDLAKQEALVLHERMTERKIRLLGDRVSRRTAWMMALDHGWSSIEDAEYLAVTQLQADALIALGPALASIAVGIVPLAEINDLRRL